MKHTIDNPLRIRWDNLTSQYKVSKPDIEQDVLVSLEVATELTELNDLLLNKLEYLTNLIDDTGLELTNEEKIQIEEIKSMAHGKKHKP